MPLYEYTCRDCGHTETAFSSMRERDQPMECPPCNASLAEDFPVVLMHRVPTVPFGIVQGGTNAGWLKR